ncbi:MAG: CBS domain-containing protein [Candidatus Methanomethylophilaceae archaeon]|nr:CBS domain-containing protein [Candidatus Methanomethylophilaceae archaeon]MBO5669508.1 CBS domain-containing protein [Candidatus Methanomethylophilaceae archaeon]
MRFPPASDIRKRRKMLDITQSELAEASGVSQSTITKVEQGKISASYNTVVKLFETLEKMGERKKEIPIMDIATRDIVSVQEDSGVHEALEILKETGFSQMPVFRGDSSVGSISEKVILKLMNSGKSMDQLSRMRVSDVMEDSFPTISENTSMEGLSSMLNTSNAVLITRKGKIIGMITRADVLKLV